MHPLLARSDSRVLTSLIDSGETPRSIPLCSIAIRALIQRKDFEKEIQLPSFQAWVKRNLRLLAALEVDGAKGLRILVPDITQEIVDSLILSDARIRTLLQYCRFADPPRHSHISEVILGQRRLMRWILQHHPFPPALYFREEWVKEFEENWLAVLTLIPCVCNYDSNLFNDALSKTAKQEICSSQCKRREQLSNIVLADLHGLTQAGIANLCKTANVNTFPLAARSLDPIKRH